MNEETGYNGWSNRNTWWLETFYDDLKDMAFARNDWEGVEASDEIKTLVDDIGNGRDVDWYEIALSWIRDEIENRDYEAKAQG